MKNLINIQQDSNDCGAACIETILNYYKGYVSMEQIKLDANMNKEGITAYDMVETLKKYGFNSYGTKLTLKELESLHLPCILHLQYQSGYNHYVVLLKSSNNSYVVMNPASGIEKLSSKELLDIWSKVAIICYPLAKIPQYSKSMTLKILLFNIFKKNFKTISVILSLGICLNIISIISSFYLQFILSKSFSIILLSLLIFLNLVILKAIINYYFSVKTVGLAQKNTNELNIYFINHILHLPIQTLSNRTTGDILKRIEELENISSIFNELFINITNTGLIIFSCLMALFLINWKLTILLIIFTILYLAIIYLTNSKNTNKINYLIQADTRYENTLVEVINNYETIKNLNNTVFFTQKIEGKQSDLTKEKLRYYKNRLKQESLNNLILELGLFLTISFGLILINKGELILASLFTYITVVNYLFSYLEGLSGFLVKYFYAKQSYLKISDFLDLQEERKEKSKTIIEKGDIVLDNVSFTYNNDEYVIKNLNQVIKTKSKIFLSGASGTGKSTLMKLLYAVYTPSSGHIYLDNKNICEYNVKDLRTSITFVSQKQALFLGTILENLTLNCSYSDEEIKQVLKITCLESLINKLPLGLNTMILEQASNFSGGEQQRLILAQSLLKKSKILLLDEALSQVDLPTEIRIVKNILNNYQDTTIIYSSHKDLAKYFDYSINMSVCSKKKGKVYENNR